MLGQELPRALRSLLTATVGMHEQPRGGLPLTERPCQGLVHQRRPPLIGHCPPDHRPRAQIEDDGKLQPACTCRTVRNIPNGDGIGCLHRTLPLELVRGYRLCVPRGSGRLEPAPRCAGPARLSQHAPDTAPADLQSLRRPERREAAGAVGATPLRTIALPLLLHLLLDVRVGAGRATKPLLRATT